MKKDKLMYKSEINRLIKLRNSLNSGHLLNGSLAIIGEASQLQRLTAIQNIDGAIFHLQQIIKV